MTLKEQATIIAMGYTEGEDIAGLAEEITGLLNKETMVTQPRDNKGRFIAKDNDSCVPVPKEWLKRLIEVKSKRAAISVSESYLLGYIDSANSFL